MKKKKNIRKRRGGEAEDIEDCVLLSGKGIDVIDDLNVHLVN